MSSIGNRITQIMHEFIKFLTMEMCYKKSEQDENIDKSIENKSSQIVEPTPPYVENQTKPLIEPFDLEKQDDLVDVSLSPAPQPSYNTFMTPN